MRLSATLSHRFDTGFALDVSLDIDFDRAPIAGLFGPSGCGKSTTLGALAGLLTPARGRIALDDDVLLEGGRSVAPEKRRVGLVAQHGLLFPHLDVLGNLRYGETRSRRAQGPALERVVEVLEIADLLERSPATLSGGERQRVALARAILAAPRLLLLDEPVSALDTRARFRVLDFVERIVTEFGVPALYVSHHRSEMLRLAGQVTRLEGGRVVETGPAESVLPGAPADGPVWNLFQVDAEGGTAARCGDGRLVLPSAVDPGRVWCRVSSGAITLTLPEQSGAPTSARNRLVGEVVHVAADDACVRVAIDAGVPLQVDLTPEAVQELGVAPGLRVVCVFKAHAIDLL